MDSKLGYFNPTTITSGPSSLLTNRFVNISTDFLFPATSNSPASAWGSTALASGTSGTGLSDANHVGVAVITSSASANSGYSYNTSIGAMLLAGGESSTFIFKVSNTTDAIYRLGFQDNTNQTAPVDGVWINIANVTLTGKTSSNSSVSTTSSSYTLTADTWYRANVQLNVNATLATFVVYDANGAQVWSDTLSTNIPTGSGRQTGHGMVAYNTGTSALQIFSIDYMDLNIPRVLVR